MKNIIIILILITFSACNEKQKNEKNVQIVTLEETEKNEIEPKNSADLQTELEKLKNNCLDFENLSSVFENSDYKESEWIDRMKESWLYDLDLKNPAQFEKAYSLNPKCKVFENKNIVSIAFADRYDYHYGIHLFTFQKNNFKPVSSFVFYEKGGDAEDYWQIEPKRIGPLIFEITETVGRDENLGNEGGRTIDKKVITRIEINPVSGLIKKDTLN